MASEAASSVRGGVGSAKANSMSGDPFSPVEYAAQPEPGTASLQPPAHDEHLVDLDELERRLATSRSTGLSSHEVARVQSESPRLNMLPTDGDTGHGSIHELVAVLRDGNWIHTRAENLLRGDIISLKENQCVPADVRIFESADMWVDQSALTGKHEAQPCGEATTSVFGDDGVLMPYMEATNVAFYGTTVTRGSGKAIVLRTGADTVLGTIADAVIRNRGEFVKNFDVPLTESMKQFGVLASNDMLPSTISRVSSLVVEHSDVIKRTVVSATFGVNPPTIVEVDDSVLANEIASEDLEREVASQMLSHCRTDRDAELFVKALAACRHRVVGDTIADSIMSTVRVPSLPKSSPIAAAFVIDPVRDQNAILRFGANFGVGSPRARKTRVSTQLHGQISGCEVYVHFDEEHSSHVVLLQGPTREILSRCSKVRRQDSVEVCAFETSDLHKLQDMVADLEARGQTVVSFAELYLNPEVYPVDVKFDIENINFPTSGMCYLGSLGLVEKLHPEVVLMGSFGRATDVRLLIAVNNQEFPRGESSIAILDEDEVEALRDLNGDEASEAKGVRAICKVSVDLREASTGEVVDIEACVFSSSVLSVSSTLSQWKQILLEHAIVIFDGCTPAQIDLLVEMLQELGECVGLVASGSANALAVASADVGFAVPTHDTIDLCEEAADIVLGSDTCPRSDAIRLIEAVKKLPCPANANHFVSASGSRAKATLVNLFREGLNVGRMLGVSDSDLHQCFEHAFQDFSQSLSPQFAPISPLRPPSPIKIGASAFRINSPGPEATFNAEVSTI